jgi:hypothetical protein
MGGDGTGADLSGAQIGDAQIGTVAGHDVINGADPARLMAMVEMLIRNHWDDRQDRDVRQTQADYHREMTRQRLEVIAADVQATRQWVIGLAVFACVLAAVVVAVVIDRLGMVGGAGAALAFYYYLRTR